MLRLLHIVSNECCHIIHYLRNYVPYVWNLCMLLFILLCPCADRDLLTWINLLILHLMRYDHDVQIELCNYTILHIAQLSGHPRRCTHITMVLLFFLY